MLLTETLPEAPFADRFSDERAGTPAAADLMPLQVFIVYENVSAARRATQAMLRLAARTEPAVDCRIACCRFDLLEHAEWREAASNDALAADIIVIATHRGSRPTPAVDRWLETAVAVSAQKQVALLFLSDASDAWSLSFHDEKAV